MLWDMTGDWVEHYLMNEYEIIMMYCVEHTSQVFWKYRLDWHNLPDEMVIIHIIYAYTYNTCLVPMDQVHCKKKKHTHSNG